MFILWMNLFTAYFFSAFARYFSKPVLNGQNSIRPNKFLAILTGATIILVSGLRSNIGDTSAYTHIYESVHFTWDTIGSRKGIGFNLLQMILQNFSNDPQILIFVVALITNLLIVMVLYKYARLFELSLFVYLTNGLFITGMNGIRQFLAAAILFAASKYLFNGDWKKYFIVVLVAAQIHNTAYIMIPIYFLVRTKAWSRTTFILLSFAIVMVLGFSQFSSLLFSALEDTSLGGYENADYQGANIIRVLIFAVPIFLAFLGREKLSKICPNHDYIVNMSILCLVFMFISTKNWIFARFSYYFGLYFILLISWIVKAFSNRTQNFIYYSIIIFYFLFFYYENAWSLPLNYKSNFLTW